MRPSALFQHMHIRAYAHTYKKKTYAISPKKKCVLISLNARECFFFLKIACSSYLFNNNNIRPLRFISITSHLTNFQHFRTAFTWNLNIFFRLASVKIITNNSTWSIYVSRSYRFVFFSWFQFIIHFNKNKCRPGRFHFFLLRVFFACMESSSRRTKDVFVVLRQKVRSKQQQNHNLFTILSDEWQCPLC